MHDDHDNHEESAAGSDALDPATVTPTHARDPDGARPTGRAPSVSLDDAVRRRERWPDLLTGGLWLVVLCSWPLASLALADEARMRAPVTVGVWLVCGLMLALGLAAAHAAVAGHETRTSRATGRVRRVASVASGLLAVPGLSLCATLPAMLPSFAALPRHHQGALVVASVGAAWLTWSSLRRSIDALRGQDGRRIGRRTARWLVQAARALHDALPDSGERPERWATYGRGRADVRLATELWEVHRIGIQRGVIELEAARGHLPRAVADRVRQEAGDGVTIEVRGPRHLVVASRSAARAGRVAGQLLAGWSGRERLGLAGEDGDDEHAGPRRGRAAGGRATPRPVREPGGMVRAAVASLLAAAVVWWLARQAVIFPVWEASTWAAITLLGAGLVAALAHALPGRGLRTRVVRDAVLGAAVREVLDLMWTLGASVDEADVEEVARTDATIVRSVHIESVVLSARLTVWWAGVGPHGVVHGERLELTAREGETPGMFGVMALCRLQEVLAALDWPWRVDATADGAGERVTMVSDRALGTGQGAWRELTWRLGDEAVLVDDREPRSRLVPVAAQRPIEAVVSRTRGGGRGWVHLAACVAVSLVVVGLPRVDAGQFEVPADAVTGDDLSSGAALALACPEAGATVYESLRAVRCLANAAGQDDRRLESLDWSVLLDPIATAVDAMTEIAALGALASCEEVGARASTLAEAGAVDFAIATLGLYRKETWASLHFFWPSRLVRDGRRLDWTRLEAALERCQGTLGRRPVTQARQLYQLSTTAFGRMYED